MIQDIHESSLVGRGHNASARNKPRFLWVCSMSLSKILWEKEKLLVTNNFSFSHSVFYPLKGGPSDLGTKNFQKTKKSPLYYQSLLIFIHKTPVVESHPTTREIRESLRSRSTPTGIPVYFYMSSSLINILEIHRRKFQT